MTPQAALIELLARLGARDGAAVLVSDEELSQWPAAAVAAMKSQRLLAKAQPGRQRDMPRLRARVCDAGAHPARATAAAAASFIVCDKRSDINRVPVPADRLEQWQTTLDMVADCWRGYSDLERSASAAAEGNQWPIGVLKGKKHKARITLLAGDGINLSLAGHMVPLIDVLAIEKNVLTLDKGELIRLVDKPAGDAETETPQQRGERLRARVREEKSRGQRRFLDWWLKRRESRPLA